MSSGTALLQQLRKRQRPASTSLDAEHASASLLHAGPASKLSLDDGAASTSLDVGGMRIVVCNGVDCTGHGSGAALLEIEELCQELSYVSKAHEQRLRVLSGVCTLQCTNAPVVNVQRQAAGNSAAVVTSLHSKVDGPLRCQQVVDDAACEMHQHHPRAAPTATARSIMLRRADGLRWAALRQESRSLRHGPSAPPRPAPPAAPPCPLAPSRPLSQQLVSALEAEAKAAAADDGLSERAARRAARLTHRLARQRANVT